MPGLAESVELIGACTMHDFSDKKMEAMCIDEYVARIGCYTATEYL